MSGPHLIGGFLDKRAELAGMVNHPAQRSVYHRARLMHLDATLRLFDPDLRPKAIRPRQLRAHSDWSRPGECLRLIHDALRDAAQPMMTPNVAKRIMAAKGITDADSRARRLIQKIMLTSLSRAM